MKHLYEGFENQPNYSQKNLKGFPYESQPVQMIKTQYKPSSHLKAKFGHTEATDAD